MSSFQTETTQVNTRQLNAAFLRGISEGHEKQAAADGTAFIREIVRQESAVRDILVPVPLTDAELDPDDRTDQPRKIVEKEPQSFASQLEFRGQPEVRWIDAMRYSIYFFKIASVKSVKPKEELMTYRSDIRQIMAENKVKDMADVEDRYWNDLQISAVNTAPTVLSTQADQFGPTGFKRGFQAMLERRRAPARILMTKSLQMNTIDLPPTIVSNNVAEAHYKDGIEKENRLWGVPITTTIKSDIYAKNAAWIYASPNFLGNFFTLQDATLFIKQEANIIEFYTYEIIGMGIGNRLAVQRIEFGSAV